MARSISKNLDYVTKDYEGFRKQMIDLIPSKTSEWTDFSENDLGIVLIELLASGLDVLSMYQDKAFTEATLPTAQNRKSVINLCKSLGYTLAPQTPSKFNVKFIKSSDAIDDEIVIAKGTKVSTDPTIGNPVIFETDNNLVIKSGEEEGSITVTQGETMFDEVAGVGSGQPNQRVMLGMPDVLVNTLNVYTTLREQDVEDGAELDRTYWVKVDDFLNSSPEDRHYMVDVDEFNNTYLVFGNGVSAQTVSTDLNINATYRYGGGLIGNVGLNTINTLPYNDIAGISIITNPELPIVKGRDSESIEHARDSAPRQFRMQDRLITRQDFLDLCLMDEDVALAEVVETFNAEKEVDIYIVPTDYSDTIPQELKDKLVSIINSKKLLTDKPVLKDPSYLPFDIDIKVIAYSNFVNSQVEEAVSTKLRQAFGIENMNFNEEVLIASIYSECLSVVGVKNIIINNPTQDILPYDSEHKIPRVAKLRNVTVKVEGGVDV